MRCELALTIPFKVKVVKIGNSLRVTIPKAIAGYLCFHEGDTAIMTVPDNKTLIIKKEE